jgi:hypothetical protein
MMRHRSWSFIGSILICQLVLVSCQPDSRKSSNSNTPPATATVKTEVNSSATATNSTGQFGFTPDKGSKNISASDLSTAPGALTSGAATTAAGVNPYANALDPAAKTINVENLDTANTSGSSINVSSGAIRSVGGVTADRSRIPVTSTGITQK